MIEVKDGYEGFLEDDGGRELLAAMFLKQATDQIQAAGARPVRWYFSQKQVADFAKNIFNGVDDLQNIEIRFEPWSGRKK
jgi:hypothetical protein